MEVLTKLGVDWKLLLAQAVNFAVLLWVLRRYAYQPMLDFLAERAGRIEKGLKDAEAAQAKLGEMEEKEKLVLAEARTEAKNIIAAAEAAAKKRDALMLEETKGKIDRMIADTDRHLAERQAQLLREAKAELAETVVLATKKVLSEQVTVAVDQELVRKSLGSH